MKDNTYIHQLITKLETINKNNPEPVDLALIQQTIDFIQPYYNQLEPGAISRPLAIAYMTTQYCTETDTIVTALLQDLPKQTTIDLEDISQRFGKTVSQKLEKLSNLTIDHSQSTMETIKQMREENATDLLIIKLLDNIYEMQHVGLQHIKQQKEAALRSLKNFLPIAIYIELQEIEKELLSLCQPILNPKTRNNKTSSIFNPDFGLSALEF